jgi:hypothetical protein
LVGLLVGDFAANPDAAMGWCPIVARSKMAVVRVEKGGGKMGQRMSDAWLEVQLEMEGRVVGQILKALGYAVLAVLLVYAMMWPVGELMSHFSSMPIGHTSADYG